MSEPNYITIDPKLRKGGFAIADNDVKNPVRILLLGKIFATVRDCKTNYEWSLMSNRLKAIEPVKTVLVFEGDETELTTK